jgi:hypothetical protein
MERSERMNALEAWLSGSERGVNEGGEGVYILQPPKVIVVYFLVVPGSSGVTSDHLG